MIRAAASTEMRGACLLVLHDRWGDRLGRIFLHLCMRRVAFLTSIHQCITFPCLSDPLRVTGTVPLEQPLATRRFFGLTTLRTFHFATKLASTVVLNFLIISVPESWLTLYWFSSPKAESKPSLPTPLFSDQAHAMSGGSSSSRSPWLVRGVRPFPRRLFLGTVGVLASRESSHRAKSY